MAFSPKETVVLKAGPFIGLDATSDPLNVDAQHAIAMLNVVPFRKFGAYATTQGRTGFTGSNLPAAFASQLIQVIDTSSNVWYVAYLSNGDIYKFNATNNVSVQTGLTGSYGQFCQQSQWSMFSDGTDTPIKIDNTFNVTNWGIAAPATAPNLVGTFVSGGGLIPGEIYAYCVTFGNANLESSPSPLTGFYTVNGAVTSTNVTIDTAAAGVWEITLTVRLGEPWGYVTYTATGSDTVDTIAAGLVAGTFTFSRYFGGGSIPFSDIASVSGATISISQPANGSGTISAPSGGAAAPTNFTVGGSILADSANAIILSSIPLSADPQVTLRNIYRIGGSQSEFQLVGTINDNTTTTYTDSLADGEITGQTLVEHRDPPANFFSVITYQDRAWGLGYSNAGNSGGLSEDPVTRSDVWYSDYEQPWAFDNTNQVIPVGRNINGDYIVGGASLPGVLFVLKQKSSWGIYGSSQSDYVPVPLFFIGCAGVPGKANSIATAYGFCFWLSEEGTVYQFDGYSAPQDLSTRTGTACSVKGILDSLDSTDYNAAVGFCYKQSYLLSFPTQGFTLGYYIPQQAWFYLGFATDAAYFDTEGQTLLGSVTGTGQVAQWFSAETDLGVNINSYFKTGIVDDPTQSGASQARHLIVSSNGNSGGTANVILTCYQSTDGTGDNVLTETLTISLAPNRQTISLPAGLTGQQFQLEVQVPSSSALTFIDYLNLYAIPKRVMSPA